MTSVVPSVDAVAHGNDDRGFAGKVAGVEGNGFEPGSQVAADGFEVLGAGCLHLDLHLPVFGVDIVEHLLAAAAGVALDIGIEILVDVEQLCLLRQLQPQVVESRVAEVARHSRGSFAQGLCTKEQQRPEVEIVAQAARLVVDDRCLNQSTVGLVVRVGIEQSGSGIVGDAHHAFEGEVAQPESCVAGIQQGEVGVAATGYRAEGGRGVEPGDGQEGGPVDRLGLRVVRQQVDGVYRLAGAQLSEGFGCLLRVGREGYETVDSLHGSGGFNGVRLTGCHFRPPRRRLTRWPA